MRRYVGACVAFAVMGAISAAWLTHELPQAKVAGQDQGWARNPPGKGDGPRRAPARTVEESIAAPLEPDLSEYTPEERVNITVYDKTNRGVVHIMTRGPSSESFFSLEGPTAGSGSGSVLDRQGHILTNFHVVEGANEIRVTLFTGETYDAGLVGRDPLNDVAVLRIDAPAEALFPIELGDSSRLRVGQKVLALGNPFGLDRTLTQGILSSLNRTLPSRAGRDMKSIIQIDAALNQGNSGGPLLNSRGQLIGMNTAIASSTGANTGVGFAIPVNTIKRVVPQLIENGRVIRPVIGIASVYETQQGLVIIELVPGGPADRAGLRGFRVIRKKERRGPFVYERTQVDRAYADVIIGADGRRVATGDELLDVVESKKPGERLIVRVLREGRQVDVLVILGASE